MGLRARRPGPVLAAIVALVAAASTAVTAASAQVSCDPIQTTPEYLDTVPTGNDVASIGFEIGSQEVTSAQSNDYIAAEALLRRAVRAQEAALGPLHPQ